MQLMLSFGLLDFFHNGVDGLQTDLGFTALVVEDRARLAG
jgi:hypothetical protein